MICLDFVWENVGFKNIAVQWNGFCISAPSGRGKDLNFRGQMSLRFWH